MDNTTTACQELLSSPWICKGTEVCWETVLPLATLREYRKNETIIQAGQTLEALGLLKSGVAKTVAVDAAGHEKIIWFMESGCVLGETPLLNEKPCAYYFQAVERCQVYWFSKEVLFGILLPRYPEINKALLSIMARKIHILSTQTEEQAFLKPLVRVAKVIYLFYANKKETGWKEYPSLPVSQEEIANLLGLHRVTVNQALQSLRIQGVLENNTHRIIVRDLERLRRAASQDLALTHGGTVCFPDGKTGIAVSDGE